MTGLALKFWTDDKGQDIAKYAVMLAVIFGISGRALFVSLVRTRIMLLVPGGRSIAAGTGPLI